jgi:intracellular multiplication protein IcmC
MKALYCLKTYGESKTMMSGNTSIKEPLSYFLVGSVLVYLPTGFQILMNSTFGPNSSILAYADSSNPTMDAVFGQNSAVGTALALIIQTIGLIAFIRGWVLIAKSASQGQPPGGTGKGMVHVFGGILAMNIVGTLEIINNTLYGSS